MRYTKIDPLSPAELKAAGPDFDAATNEESRTIPVEDHSIRGECERDPIFAEVAYHVFRGVYRDPPRPCPSPDKVAHAAEVFERLAPKWWAFIGLGMFS